MQEEFEKWWIKKYQHTIESSYAKYVEFARDAWQARQAEIDSLKAEVKLAQASERKAVENNVKMLNEHIRLKRLWQA